MASNGLRKIIWVASRPPIPPWSGALLTTLSGIHAAASATEVRVIAFADEAEREAITAAFHAYWNGQPVTLDLVPNGPRAGVARSLLRRRFQLSSMLETPALRAALYRTEWSQPSRLVVFDDIVFAPLLTEFGSNAIMSPHDCVSRMFLSHFRAVRFSRWAPKLYLQYLVALRYEAAYYHLALLTHFVTQRDRMALESINPRARCHVVSYGEWAAVKGDRAADRVWDVLVWVDLAIPALARNTRDLIELARRDPAWWSGLNVILVGRVPPAQAEHAIGGAAWKSVEYARYLEDADGRIKRAKIVLIPDAGGAGIKSRCLSVLAAGQCLACLYSQMDGLECVCDRGAINAFQPQDLLAGIRTALRENSFPELARTGASIFQQRYSRDIVRQGWLELIERAVAVRTALQSAR
jgi:hypothetical protein